MTSALRLVGGNHCCGSEVVKRLQETKSAAAEK